MAMGVQVETVDPVELYEVITGACSSDQARIIASGKRLKEMLEMFGTFNALHDIASQRNQPQPIRQQAIIQFKLAALSHWKSRKLLSDAQRIQIRNRCLGMLDEPDDSIAQFNTVITAKIARHDFPINWYVVVTPTPPQAHNACQWRPTLVNDLMGIIDSNLRKRYDQKSSDVRDALLLRRSLQLINAILKELASVKMLNGVKTMAALVEQLRQVFYDYYSTVASTFSTSALANSPDPTRLCEDVYIGHLVFKSISKMAIWLWHRIDKLSKDEHTANQVWISGLFQNCAAQIQNLVNLRKQIVTAMSQNPAMSPYLPVAKILTKHILTFGKYFRRTQQLSQQRFAQLPSCGDLVLFYWSQIEEASSSPEHTIADSDEVLYPLRFLVQGMVLFKESLSQWSEFRRDGTANQNSLSKEFVENAVKLLVTRFMPLNPSDLEHWMADPEEWLNEEERESDQWEFEIRACSERVLLQLSNQFSHYVVPLLKGTFDQVALQQSLDLAGILQKEAIYCAIGRCALRLKDQLPFDQWLENTLAAETLSQNPKIAPHLGIIAGPIPKLWTEANDDWLLKGTLLTTVTKLVEAVGERASSLDSITIPLIQESLSPGVMINLDEDGLILWLAVLRNATSLANPNSQYCAQDLFPRALSLLATNLDLLGRITGILESYFFLDSQTLLQQFGADIFQAFTIALKSSAALINLKDMIVDLEYLVQLAPSSLWGEPLHTSGLFCHLINTLVEGEASPMLLIEIIFLFARIIMADRQMFVQLLSAAAQATNQKEDYLWEGLLDQWWGKFDNMSEPRHRKLTAMGIATLVATGRPEVLKRLPGEIFNLWLDVFGEIKETKLMHDDSPVDLELVSPTNLRRHWELDEAPSEYYQNSEGTLEYDRRKTLYNRDPIRVAPLNEYVGAQLQQAEAIAGPQFQTYLLSADRAVFEQIQAELQS
ncbi:hypothetical protein NMY22_g1252 [Coprinellus aureogranulatus]|nr:hypothetical protein NMY22_g1252 [Coprinellus aureogranulatus]